MISHGLSKNYLYSNRDEFQKDSSVELRKVVDEDQHDAGFFWKLIWSEDNQSYKIADIFGERFLTVQEKDDELTCDQDVEGSNEFKFEFDQNDFYSPRMI